MNAHVPFMRDSPRASGTPALRADGVARPDLHGVDNAEVIAARAILGRPPAQQKQNNGGEHEWTPRPCPGPWAISGARPSAASAPAQRPDLVFAQP